MPEDCQSPGGTPRGRGTRTNGAQLLSGFLCSLRPQPRQRPRPLLERLPTSVTLINIIPQGQEDKGLTSIPGTQTVTKEKPLPQIVLCLTQERSCVYTLRHAHTHTHSQIASLAAEITMGPGHVFLLRAMVGPSEKS